MMPSYQAGCNAVLNSPAVSKVRKSQNRDDRERPWIRLFGLVLAVTLLLPVYAFLASGVSYLITPGRFDVQRWVEHNVADLLLVGFIASLVLAAVTWRWPHKPLSRRQRWGLSLVLVLVPVLSSLWLKFS